MKIGKYPVKHKYSISRMVSDVISLGFIVMIFSVTVSFIATYNELLTRMGEYNVAVISANVNGAFAWRHYLAWIFPALSAAVLAAYIVLCCVSHPFKNYAVTKRTAQQCREIYVFCASLCKIPLLMGIFDAMYIFHQRMLGQEQSLFSLQIVLDVLLIAIIIRLGIHRVTALTEKGESGETETEELPKTVKIKKVEREENQ